VGGFLALLESVVEDTGEGIKSKPKKLTNERCRWPKKTAILIEKET
jgi:hypothetical protein